MLSGVILAQQSRFLPWQCSFRSTFRLFPDPSGQRDQLDVFLASDGKTMEEVLAALPYHRARAATPGELPNAKRYRDGRQLLRTVGLVYDEADGKTWRLHVTDLGHAVRRWRPLINTRNSTVLGRHAAQALAACQLRNPTREGRRYGPDVVVFPFAFIWRSMLALDGWISSEELNRAIFRTENEDDLQDAINRIRIARRCNDPSILGDEVVTERAKNDRILVWMAWASFGWTLIGDKRQSTSGVYEIAPNAERLLSEAAALKHRHRDFTNEINYIEYISECAGLPEDLR